MVKEDSVLPNSVDVPIEDAAMVVVERLLPIMVDAVKVDSTIVLPVMVEKAIV